MFFLLLLGLLLFPGRSAVAAAPAGPDSALCADAIRRVEASRRLPRGLLGAVALSESGRREPGAGRFAPWPWTVNNAGDGRYFATKGEAMAWVEELRRAGRRNIDVGCMQVNLMHHPGAFGDLGEALDPLANVGYGASFLKALRDETDSWDRAVERYHTAEPERGGAYRERVYAHWGGARGGPPTTAKAAGPARPPGERTGLLRLGREPRFLPLVYGRPPATAVGPTRPLLRHRAGGATAGGRRLPAVLGPSPAAAAPGAIGRQPRRAALASLLMPAPGRITVLTGGFLAPPSPPRDVPGDASGRGASD